MSVAKAVSNLVIEVLNHVEHAKTNENVVPLQESEWFKKACAELDETVEKYIGERVAEQTR